MQTQNEEKSRWVEEAIDKYQGPLLRYTLRLIGNIEKAREIVQETFLKLWKVDMEKIKDYLAPWLFKLCRNHSLDLLKKEKKMELIENDHLVEDTSGRDPAGVATMHDQVDCIKDAMKLLPMRQQEVLVLKFQNDLSYKEISDITGLSVSNVGYLIHEGVQNLRRHLKDAGEVL